MYFKSFIFIAACTIVSLSAIAQLPSIYITKARPFDTIVIYDPYSQMVGINVTGNKDHPYDTISHKGAYTAATRADTISPKDHLSAYTDCSEPDGMSIYSKVVTPYHLKLYQYIKQNLQYPDDAKNKKKHGVAVVEFKLSDKGQVSGAHIFKSVYPSIDAEAVRLVSGMTGWKPRRRTENYRYRIMLKF